VNSGSNSEYAQIFTHRGSDYAEAMRRLPEAREAEFTGLFRYGDGSARIVADVPSGGGYLRPYLPASALLDEYDPTAQFRQVGAGILPVDLQDPRLARSDYDLVVSLASIHHVLDKRRFFGALVDHCSSGARLVVADVAADSKVARFLDEFVGRYNGTGHRGWFLSPADPFDFGRGEPRVRRVEVDTLDVPWLFPGEEAMISYCRLLFGMREVASSELAAALRDHVGVESEGGRVALQWQLTYIYSWLD
jgi:SAM-dependent methyltransferase